MVRDGDMKTDRGIVKIGVQGERHGANQRWGAHGKRF